MSRVRIYLEPSQVVGRITLKENETVHKLKNVLRLVKADSLYVFDGQGKEYLYTVAALDKNSITIERVKKERDEKNPLAKIILGFPLLQEEKVDFILQKATELGVCEFIPFTCAHTIHARPSLSKVRRWQKIVIEAARQSERLWIPLLHDVLSFSEIICNNYKCKLIASVNGKKLNDAIANVCDEIFIMTGPEGDFSISEYNSLKENNFQFVRLSGNILRAETASIFAVGILNYFLNHES